MDDTDQVSDASRISPPRIDQFDPEAAFLAIHGRIDQPVGVLKDISSPSHPVVIRDGENRWTIALADNAAVPDRDFVLRWTEVENAEVVPSAWMDSQASGAHALLRLKAPVEVQVAEKPGQDFYFLTDRSGSMEGLKWTKAVQAFQEFLKVLGPKDRVWATFFETSFQDLAEKPLPAAKLLQDRNVMQLERLGTGGGTELLPALNHVLEKAAEHSSGTATSVVLITDGQVGNEAEILSLARQHGNLRMHTFGIDTAVNEGFLKKLASQSQGSCCLLNPEDDIVGAVVRLANRLAKPVLTSIRVGAGWELPMGTIPDLHAGEVCLVPLRCQGEAASLRLTGRLLDGRDWAHAITPVPAKNPAFRLLWLKQRIEHELNAGRSEAAIQLAKAVNLVCKGTAFIAWDEQEKVAVATQAVYQPSHLQAAMDQVAFFAGGVASETLCAEAPPPTRQGIYQMRFMARTQVSPALHPSSDLPPVTRLRELLRRLQPDGGLLGNMLFVAATQWQRVAASSSQPMVLMERLEELERDVTELAQRLEALRRQLAEHCSDLVRDARSLADAMDRHILAASDPVSVGPWKACLESVDLATAWLCKAGPLGEELQRKANEAHDLERAIRERVNRFREEARASCLAGQA